MKSPVAYIFVIALVGGVMSARLRRQAPPAPDAAVDPGAAPGGAPGDITTPGDGTGVIDMNSAKGYILGDLNNQQSMGVPVDPNKIDTVLMQGPAIGKVGSSISDPNKQMISDLQSAPALVDDAAAGAPAGTA